MIVLDTNVLSEALRPEPAEAVIRWMAEQNRDAVFTTVITQAEILHGIEMLAPGKRRSRLQDAVERLFTDEFHGRIIPFDAASALLYPKIVSNRMRAGRPISQFDAVIASICRSRGATLATRNEKDFEDCGLAVLNPWNVYRGL